MREMRDGDEARRLERLEREDLVLFVNACFACTGQREFYGGRSGQQVSVDFLHRYTLGNYASSMPVAWRWASTASIGP